MSQQKNPLGLHIQRMASPNDDWIRNHVAQADYATCTSLDASGMAADLQQLGVPYSIVRFYDFEPSPHGLTQSEDIQKFAQKQYETVASWARVTGNPNIHVYVNNEQGHTWQRLMMYRFMMDAAMADPQGPVGLVFLNAAPGTIRHGFWGEPNDCASDEFMKLLLTFDKYRDVRLPSGAYAFLLGVHNYTSQYAWIAVNAGRHRVPSWEMATKFDNGEFWVDWSLSQDHLGREYQGIRHALGWRWNNVNRQWYTTNGIQKREDGSPVEPPWMIVTECLFDNMQDVRNVHPDLVVDDVHEPGRPAETNPRGYHTLATIWRKWFGDAPAGHTLSRMLKWAWKHIYAPEGYFVGFNYFSFGNTGGHISYTNTPNAVADPDYFTDITHFRTSIPDHFFHKEIPPMPEPTPVPVPAPTPSSNVVTWLLGAGLALAIVLVLFLVLSSHVAVSSQAVSTTPISLEQAAELLLAAIVAIVMGSATVPVVEPLVNLLKWIADYFSLDAERFSADRILLVVSTVITLAVWVAGHFGFQLDSVFGLLVTVLPILTQLLTSIFGSKALYALASGANVAGFGYQRS